MSVHACCPACRSFGLARVHRRWWRRILQLSPLWQCLDCEHRFAEPKYVTADGNTFYESSH